MRRFDKKKNIQKANLLAEQRYLQSKGLLNEVDKAELEAPTEPEVAEPETDSKVPDIPTTDASNFSVRFNLANTNDPITGKPIFMTWKVEPNGKTGLLGDDVLGFNPNEYVDKIQKGGIRNNFDSKLFDINMGNCKLTNSVSTAYKIYNGSNKTPIAYVKCSDVKINPASNEQGSPDSEVIYNPRIAPYWRMRTDDVFQNLDSDAVELGDKLPKYDEGVIYAAPITPVKRGETVLYNSRFFALKLNGELYIKEVKDGPDVDNYKAPGEVFIGVDGKTFSNLYTTGNKIYVG